MQDSLHVEWSTKTFDVLSHLITAIKSRPRTLSTHTPLLSANHRPLEASALSNQRSENSSVTNFTSDSNRRTETETETFSSTQSFQTVSSPNQRTSNLSLSNDNASYISSSNQRLSFLSTSYQNVPNILPANENASSLPLTNQSGPISSVNQSRTYVSLTNERAGEIDEMTRVKEVGRREREGRFGGLHMNVKVEVSNVSCFVCNSQGG